MVLAYGSGGQHMNEQEKHAVSQEERKEKIRARYKGVDRSELEFIPAKQKEKLFEDAGAKRVCAYCRVSTDDANQTSSYELQKNHYEDMIKEHAGWNLVGIYADEGISGTSLLHRDEFNRMITDCQAGKIDLIVTKSVSRFARNIVDCIAKVRELANMKPQVGVFFETEHIYTLDNTSEMMLAVLSAAAQEESHTKSEIMNISIEQRFSRGIFLTPKLLGYDKDEDGNLIPETIYIRFKHPAINDRLAKFAKAKKWQENLLASKDAFPSEEAFQQEVAQMNETCEQIKQHLVDTNIVVKKGVSGIAVKVFPQ